MFKWTEQDFFNQEMCAFEEKLSEQFPGGNLLLKQACRDVILSGGKRIRPALVLASCMTKEYDREQAIAVACAVEVIHTATLIHDDVIDNADIRRGKETISKAYDNKTAVLTGDYLLSKSLVLISQVDLPKQHLKKIAQAIQSMCSGEIAQHYSNNQIPSTRAYFKRIMQKTSLMFSTSCSLGAYIGGHDEKIIRLFSRLGLYLGTAFQIRDDLLDISKTQESTGKPTQNDLVNGIVTLPLLIAAKDVGFKDKLDLFLKSDRTIIDAIEIISEAKRLGGYNDAVKSFDEQIEKCHKILDVLENSQGKEVIKSIIKNLL